MLTIEVKGLEELYGRLKAADRWGDGPFAAAGSAAVATNKTAALLIRESFNRHAGQQFDSKGRHMKTPWRPLSARYAAYKARKWPSKPLMIRTTTLVKSLADRNSPWAIYRRRAKELVLGTRVPYATYHQDGSGRMPKRPLFVVTPEIAQEWTEILRDDLEARLR